MIVPKPSHPNPLREFFQDQDAIRVIATGISRAGKPEVIRATTAGAGSCASNIGLSPCPPTAAKIRRPIVTLQKARPCLAI
ncbi:hypothetical protein ACNKFQ_19150 [Klebsiella quasipneumoniae]|uniref:hypothetical protein n=1 Tax=Klebsiella quasipneumoniae TaxID=1463165 RepID=UPI0013EFB496|nr:hypothetical protein [Klebsiella quasipneumoniae]